MRVRSCIRRQAVTTAVALLLGAAFALITPLTARAAKQTRWSKLWNKYRDKKNTDRLIFVEYLGGSDCKVLMYRKVPRKNGSFRWKKILACPGYVGRNGIGKAREGDVRTPTGTFRIGEAFGILDDPGTELAYTKVNRWLYWSGEYGTYNKMVDSRKLGHAPGNSEHLADYVPHYHYVLDIGYNRKCVYGKGSAIFLHCFGTNPYTGGCIAVSEENMKTILQNATKRTRICIYPIR